MIRLARPLIRRPKTLPNVLIGVLAVFVTLARPDEIISPLPERLSETGLYVSGTRDIAPANLTFSPQYPLWADGATKRRWLYLPPGSAIDASDVDAWSFPPGTRLWKEFSLGRPVETRFIERLADGTWRFSVYVWDESTGDAWLAPESGIGRLPVANAPNGRYVIPSRDDCLACHEGAGGAVLGVNALQLSPDRDPLAPHAEELPDNAVGLAELVRRGLLANLPPAILETPPRIEAGSAEERAALGYLHANCSHCHNDTGPVLLIDMLLAQRVGRDSQHILDSLLGKPSDFHVHGFDRRVVPGNPGASVLALRMRSRNPLVQMPPLGSQLVDRDGVAIIETWIAQLQHPDQEN